MWYGGKDCWTLCTHKDIKGFVSFKVSDGCRHPSMRGKRVQSMMGARTTPWCRTPNREHTP